MLDRVELRARNIGIAFRPGIDRKQLVRAIQKAEGREACFGSERCRSCQGECEWTAECLGLVADPR